MSSSLSSARARSLRKRVEAHGRQSRRLDHRHVGARALDAKHRDLLAEKVGHRRLDRGVAAAVQHELGIAPEQAGGVDARRKVAADALRRIAVDRRLRLAVHPAAFHRASPVTQPGGDADRRAASGGATAGPDKTRQLLPSTRLLHQPERRGRSLLSPPPCSTPPVLPPDWRRGRAARMPVLLRAGPVRAEPGRPAHARSIAAATVPPRRSRDRLTLRSAEPACGLVRVAFREPMRSANADRSADPGRGEVRRPARAWPALPARRRCHRRHPGPHARIPAALRCRLPPPHPRPRGRDDCAVRPAVRGAVAVARPRRRTLPGFPERPRRFRPRALRRHGSGRSRRVAGRSPRRVPAQMRRRRAPAWATSRPSPPRRPRRRRRRLRPWPPSGPWS